MANQLFAIHADDENIAETWWDALRDRNEGFADQLARGTVVVTEDVLAELQGLPGFDGGPAYAPHPIAWTSEHQEDWAELVGGSHTFEGSL